MAKNSTEMTLLAHDLESTMDWRMEKASEYPNDERNVEAVAIFQRLIQSCLDTAEAEQGPYVTALFDYWASAMDDRDSMAMNDYKRQIGFVNFPDDVEQLCAGLLDVCGHRSEAA